MADIFLIYSSQTFLNVTVINYAPPLRVHSVVIVVLTHPVKFLYCVSSKDPIFCYVVDGCRAMTHDVTIKILYGQNAFSYILSMIFIILVRTAFIAIKQKSPK